MHEIEKNVSRETLDDLRKYQELVEKWNPSINLIAKSTLPELWDRHILDSLQLKQFLPDHPCLWSDIGSGGGFPGLVVAILAKHQNPETFVTLIESDVRKSTFLRTVIRELELNAKVLASRVENVDLQAQDIISARALAPLDKLFEWSHRLMKSHTKLIFMKGRAFRNEIQISQEKWEFEVATHPSLTDKDARIIEIWGLQRAKSK